MRNLDDLNLAAGEIVFLDRIEEGVATLLLGKGEEREESVPRNQLPATAREGDRLRMTAEGRLVVDPKATAAGRAAVADLMADLLGEPRKETDPPSSSSEEASGRR